MRCRAGLLRIAKHLSRNKRTGDDITGSSHGGDCRPDRLRFGVILTNTLYVSACYFVAVLMSQTMLLAREGAWFGAACQLHAAMSGTESCSAYVSSVHSLGNVIRYLALEMDVLLALTILMISLVGLKALSDVVRTRLNLSEPAPRGTAALSGT